MHRATITEIAVIACLVGSVSPATITEAGLRSALKATFAQLVVSPAAMQGEVSAEDIARESLLSARFVRPEQLCRVRVAPSPIAGVGVFATSPLAKGELVTCYPGDAVTYMLPDSAARDTKGVIWGLHVPDQLRHLTPEMDAYALRCGERYGVIGLRALDDNPAYVGHLVNDAARMRLRSFDSAEEYMAESMALANAGHVDLEGCHTATIATKAIAEGEEVLVSYGPNYWRSKQRRTLEQVSQIISSFL